MNTGDDSMSKAIISQIPALAGESRAGRATGGVAECIRPTGLQYPQFPFRYAATTLNPAGGPILRPFRPGAATRYRGRVHAPHLSSPLLHFL
jgi:hypothetical protein